MPYSKAPTQDTYSSERVSLFREIATRDGGLSGKDEDYLNVFMEIVRQSKTGDSRKFIMKRSGTTTVVPSVAASVVRGMHHWVDENKLVYCVGRHVYVYNVSTGVSVTLTNVFTSSTGTVGFCEFLYDNGTVKLVGTDGTAVSGVVTIDTANTVVTCSDVDLPAHKPYPVYLDGYLFVSENNTANIWNSDLNDPLAYTAGTYITAEMEADHIIRIAKLNNYLIAFGKNSIEYFWDAAVAAPDSPLQRNDTPIKINAYLAGFALYGNTVYYIGSDENGQADVFMLKDFKIEAVGTPTISRYLNTVTDGVDTWNGAVVSYQGHTFYVINAGSGKSWSIDLDEHLISRIAFQNTTSFNVLHATNVATATMTRTYFTLNTNDSTIYRFSELLYQDNGVNYTCAFTTEASDFGTMNRKTMKRFSIIGDRPPVDSTISVQWSDNDYQSFNDARVINLNQDLPSTYQLGSFRQRIFKLSYSDNYPLRVQDIEVDINKGKS